MLRLLSALPCCFLRQEIYPKLSVFTRLCTAGYRLNTAGGNPTVLGRGPGGGGGGEQYS